MSITIPISVSSCRECPHGTNNAREHDDPFTSSPLNVYWYCTHPKRKYGKHYIKDESKIDPKCPETQT